MRSLRDILNGFEKYFLIIPAIWFVGAIVNNAYLSKYGAFSWDILDWGNFSSGLIYISTLLLISFVCYIFNSYRERNFLRKVNPLLYNFFYESEFIASYYKEKNKHKVQLGKEFLICFNIGLFATIVSFIIYFFLRQSSQLIQHLINCVIYLCLGFIVSLFYLGLVNYTEILSHEIRDESDKSDRIPKLHRLAINKSFPYAILILIFVFIHAYIFGYSLYENIPRSLGGGKPIYAQFIFEKPGNSFVNPNKVYQILDETNHSFILLDSTNNTAFDLPINENNRPIIRYFKSIPEKQTFLFSADIHATNFPESNIKNDNYESTKIDTNFTAFKSLIEEWKSYDYDKAFLLGDIFEADSDYANWTNNLETFLKYLPSGQPKVYAVFGNNDFRNTKQQMELIDTFKKTGLIPEGKSTNWYKKINEDVGVISLYLPDKIEQIDEDPLFHLDTNRIKTLLKSAKDDGIKLIMILSHHGFIGENPWSFQYNLDTLRKKLSEDVVQRWINFVKGSAKIIRRYDKDFIKSASVESDVIVISGHYHSGIVTRKLDGIDHIVCPGLSQSDRDGKRFNKNMYLIMDYYPDREIVEFSFKRLGSNEARTFAINL